MMLSRVGACWLRCTIAVIGCIFVLGAAAADALPDLVDKLKPSILAVGFYKETDSPRFGFRGTGFVVGSGNLLVTCAHVIERSADTDGSLVVSTRDGADRAQIRRADIVELDRVHDLALLRLGGAALPAFTLGKPASAREGQRVAFIGFPIGSVLGLAPVTHRGTISSITTVALPSPTARQLDDRAINRIREGSFEMLQLDATAYPGNSGGPLFDADSGELLGVINMVVLKGTRESALTHPSGISYAVPVGFVLRLLAAGERK
jgi:S1-C subfamily serine protease